MVDYYQILGVPQSASADDIKSAFKRLAFQYHPDRNPDNSAAEEKFKDVNLAYQILSNPDLKYKYDLKLKYGFIDRDLYQKQNRPPPPPHTYSGDYRSFYEPFRKRRPQYGQYELGWKYVKHQAMAFGFVFFIAIMYLSVKGIIEYHQRLEFERLEKERDEYFVKAVNEFEEGHFRASFTMLIDIQKNYPTNVEILDFRNNSLKQLKRMADDSLEHENYRWAVDKYNIVREYMRGINLDLYQKLAICYKHLGEYEKAAKILDYILIQDFENLQLNLEIASIYRDILEQPEKAKEYYDRAKRRVKNQLIATYGEAYEIVMNPKHSPEIYYTVFFNSAINNNMLQDHEETIKDCNWTVFFNPAITEAFYIRGNNYQAIGYVDKACKNWRLADELNHTEASRKLSRYCN